MRKGLLLLVAAAAAPRAVAQPVAPRPLTLAAAVAQATRRSPAVELAGYRMDEARALLGEARARLLPSLSLDGTWLNRSENLASFGLTVPGFPSFIQPFDNYDARLRLTQTVFDWSAWQHLRAQRYQAVGSDADRSAATEGAARLAALAYLQAVRAAALFQARQQDSSIAAELLSLAQEQLEAGVSAHLDVTRARTELVAAQGALILARNQRRKAGIALALALGDSAGTTYVLADTLRGDLGASSAPADTAAALALALARRPDFASEAAVGARARAEHRAIAAERLPWVGFSADYGPNGLTVPSARLTQDVAVVVSLPILDGFGREARSAAQTAAAQASDTRSADLRRRIEGEVRDALIDLETGREQQAVAAQRLALAEEELSEARDRFASGVAGNIDVITAQSTLNLARDAEIDARYATAAARVGLAYAAGVAESIH